MRRRKKILVVLALAVCVVAVWLAVKWMMRPTPEMRPNYNADLGGGVTLKMVWIPGGTFDMGTEPTTYERAKRTVAGWFGKTITYPYEARESPVHEVTLDGFWMGGTEVTQAQYKAIMGNNPSEFIGGPNASEFIGPNNPVVPVTWNDATEFCRKLSTKTGKTIALPTEAQWEYACRAGSTGMYFFGEDESQLGGFAWYNLNSNAKTHPVGGKEPNAWGLYDMCGNVSEWCQDAFGVYKSGSQKNPVRNDSSIRVMQRDGTSLSITVDTGRGEQRASRGGSWNSSATYCRSARRWRAHPKTLSLGVGFRIVRTQK